jgi:cobyrinic acid a,c-diamide synthase
MRDSVRRFISSGGRFYAECGGLMYLARSIEEAEMVGILPTEIHMSERLVDFGYSEVTTIRPSILGPEGTRLRGHQFHYSKCQPPSAEPLYSVSQSGRSYPEGFRLANGIASYIHLHFLSNPAAVVTVLQL